jgi:hypothetical protein
MIGTKPWEHARQGHRWAWRIAIGSPWSKDYVDWGSMDKAFFRVSSLTRVVRNMCISPCSFSELCSSLVDEMMLFGGTGVETECSWCGIASLLLS